MLTSHRIKLTELDEHFIQELKAAHHAEDAVVYFQVHPDQGGEVMTEEMFWDIIGKLDWDKEGESNRAVVRPLVAYLAEQPVSIIFQFEEMLANKLYELDTKGHAENCGDNAWKGDEKPFSVDVFLYARACVIANGRACFEKVKADPKEMLKDLTFETLLYVASDAYEKKTGKPFGFLPTRSY